MTQFYETLGINKNASQDDIKNAYRKLARENHPDKGGNKEEFQKIQEAYDSLSNPEKRRQYDAPPFQPFQSNFNIFEHQFFDVNQFFNKNFNNKKSDFIHNCVINLDDVYSGIKKSFNLSRKCFCKVCKTTCSNCNGSGSRTQNIQLGPITQILKQICNTCVGKGTVFNKNINCKECNDGEIKENKMVEIDIPKGVENGKEIIVEGWGEQPNKNNEMPGNLIIKININNHKNFERIDLDLKYKVTITLKESLTNKKLSIPYFNIPFDIDTKDYGIINPKKEYIIFKKGLENSRGNKGNMLIVFDVIYPDYKILDTNQIEKLKNILDELSI